MKIAVSAKQLRLTDAQLKQLHERARFSLARFQHAIHHVELETSPAKPTKFQCRLQAKTSRGNQIFTNKTADTINQAVVLATNCMERQLANRQRWSSGFKHDIFANLLGLINPRLTNWLTPGPHA